MDLGRLVQSMSETPARIFNLPAGRLEEGAEADFVLFDPECQWVVEAEKFQSLSHNSSFLGETLTGRVTATFRGGRLTWRDQD